MKTVTLSEAEACSEAMRLYREEMETLLRDSEILSIETAHSLEDGMYRVVGHAVCLADIAVTAEIPLQ